MKEQHEALAVSVYVLAMKKQIEEEVESKYSKRIDYLIGANNELASKLRKSEKERARIATFADTILLRKEEDYEKD